MKKRRQVGRADRGKQPSNLAHAVPRYARRIGLSSMSCHLPEVARISARSCPVRRRHVQKI